MAIPYTFSRSSSGTLLISKTSDAGPNTQFILISTGGMGRSSIINRETSRMPAEHWESMEWYDGRDGEYYRMVFSVVQACANGTQEESNIAVTALETRHLMWGSEVNTPNPAPPHRSAYPRSPTRKRYQVLAATQCPRCGGRVFPERRWDLV